MHTNNFLETPDITSFGMLNRANFMSQWDLKRVLYKMNEFMNK